jgi:cytochrome c oxidase subunit 3
MEMIVDKKVVGYERMASSRMIVLIVIGTIIMLFAGMTSAYIVREAEGNWIKFDLPKMFWVSSGLILLSSVTMNWAVKAAKKDNSKSVSQALLLTTILGLGFVITQYLSWTTLYSQGIIFAGNPSESFLYVLTGLHVAHLLAGIIALLVTFSKASRKIYSSTNMTGLQNCAVFWHFLDGLWIYLFIFLMFVR